MCAQLPDDLNALWAYVTFYGGECQLNLNKKVTHLVVKEPKGVSGREVCVELCCGNSLMCSGWLKSSYTNHKFIMLMPESEDIFYQKGQRST